MLQQSDRRLIGPVQVVQQQDNRLPGAEPAEEVEHAAEQDLSLLLGCQLARCGQVASRCDGSAERAVQSPVRHQPSASRSVAAAHRAPSARRSRRTERTAWCRPRSSGRSAQASPARGPRPAAVLPVGSCRHRALLPAAPATPYRVPRRAGGPAASRARSAAQSEVDDRPSVGQKAAPRRWFRPFVRTGSGCEARRRAWTHRHSARRDPSPGSD